LAKKTKGKRTSPAKRILGGIWYLLVLCAVFATACGIGWIQKSPMLMAMIRNTFNPKPVSEVFGKREGLTLLLIGADENRKATKPVYDKKTGKLLHFESEVVDDQARADMILLVRLDFKDNRITGISVPRDLECRLPGYRKQKINAYMTFNAKESKSGMMSEAVSHVLNDIPIDRTVVLDYDAFRNMIDAAGGITVNVQKRMKYDDFAGNVHVDLQPGKQKLDGYNSLMYVRFRKGEGGDSDYGRQDRQKEFLVAFKNAVLSNKLALPNVANQGFQVLGGSLSEDEIATLALFAQGLKSADIRMAALPTYTVRSRGRDMERLKAGEPEQTLRQIGLLAGTEIAKR
jgi:LCP family protein required for cell wall assembly